MLLHFSDVRVNTPNIMPEQINIVFISLHGYLSGDFTFETTKFEYVFAGHRRWLKSIGDVNTSPN